MINSLFEAFFLCTKIFHNVQAQLDTKLNIAQLLVTSALQIYRKMYFQTIQKSILVEVEFITSKSYNLAFFLADAAWKQGVS